MTKREDYLSWDQYFMSLAQISAMRSKDPSKQVGCCIVNPMTQRVVSLGYNGFPTGCSDELFPWGKGTRQQDDLNSKYPYVVHAELNAILNAKRDIDGFTMYVTLSPCNECIKSIIQSGIKRVVYLQEYRPTSNTYLASLKLANVSGIQFEKYNSTNKEITLHI